MSLVESLVGAAIEFKGKIYTGYSHDRALDNARESLRNTDDFLPFLNAAIGDKIPKGFLTTKDRFVNRKEGIVIAKESKQLKEEYAEANVLQSFMVKKWTN